MLKKGRVLDWAEDRTGVYSLRNVNKLPKLRRAPRVAPATAGLPEPAPQPSLFEEAKAPETTPPVQAADRTDPTDRTDLAKLAAPPPKLGAATPESCAVVPKPTTDGGQGTASPTGKNSKESQGSTESRPPAPALTKVGFFQSTKMKIKAFFAASVGFVPNFGEGQSDQKRFERCRFGGRGGASETGGSLRRQGRGARGGGKSLGAGGGPLDQTDRPGGGGQPGGRGAADAPGTTGGNGAHPALKPMLGARLFSQISLDNGGPGGAPAQAGGLLRGRDRRRRRARGSLAAGERADGEIVGMRPGRDGGGGGPSAVGVVRGTL